MFSTFVFYLKLGFFEMFQFIHQLQHLTLFGMGIAFYCANWCAKSQFFE